MLSKFKKDVQQAGKTTKRVLLNGERFIQATALAILVTKVVGDLRIEELTTGWKYTLIAAVSVCAVRAFFEYVRFLDKD